jgi:hypothetical protein
MEVSHDRRADPDRPIRTERFEQQRATLAGAIGDWVDGGIHHGGSTAVSGLEAKPVIDILVGVSSLEESRSCFEKLGELGYLYFPYRSEEMYWFCKPNPNHRGLTPRTCCATPPRCAYSKPESTPRSSRSGSATSKPKPPRSTSTPSLPSKNRHSPEPNPPTSHQAATARPTRSSRFSKPSDYADLATRDPPAAT